jgi:hypothetical protein
MAATKSTFRWSFVFAAVALALPMGTASAQQPANAPDDAAIQRGLTVWRDVAICRYCHGWDAKGALVEGYPPATPLVGTMLDRDALIEAVSCGRPRPGMPRHRADAWTKDYPCYGMLKEEIGNDYPDPPQRRYLSPREIEDVADYVIAFYKSGPMTYENCQKYYAPAGSRLCDQYKK